VVLLDEVSMGLAPNLVDEIFGFLATLKSSGVALIVVEQFVHRALALADTVVVIARGTIRLSGRSDEFGEEEIFSAYAGTTKGEPVFRLPNSARRAALRARSPWRCCCPAAVGPGSVTRPLNVPQA